MEVTINGELKNCVEGISVSELLDSLGIDKRYIAVELNRQIIPRTLLGDHKLNENDNLEIITIVGGG